MAMAEMLMLRKTDRSRGKTVNDSVTGIRTLWSPRAAPAVAGTGCELGRAVGVGDMDSTRLRWIS